MSIVLDATIGILLVFIAITPLIWKGKKSKYFLFFSAIICISLYIFQACSKDKELERIKEENTTSQTLFQTFQKEIKQGLQIILEEQKTFQKTFESKLNKLQESGTISEDAAKKIKNIYAETVSTTAKSSSSLEDRFLQPIKGAGSVEMKEATLSYDKENNLLWAIPKIGACTWDRAAEYAKNFKMGGYLDWRLPSLSEAKIIIKKIKENESTLDIKKRFNKLGYHPTIANLPFLNLEESHYWTTESHANFANAFHPYTGNIEESSKNSINFVLLVRNL